MFAQQVKKHTGGLTLFVADMQDGLDKKVRTDPFAPHHPLFVAACLAASSRSPIFLFHLSISHVFVLGDFVLTRGPFLEV